MLLIEHLIRMKIIFIVLFKKSIIVFGQEEQRCLFISIKEQIQNIYFINDRGVKDLTEPNYYQNGGKSLVYDTKHMINYVDVIERDGKEKVCVFTA
ncbi:hypothetical protein PPL_07540 [Heterostelium album PN500]|uniref:Uncharacterized protein n=1 Tax=Heterostelium pallidum (strain ATCC 26659 / Pp 5 / PN500) TaxID=670386 RepID=D3BG89_HETP5|nr:hypothetical protein PPL_07540 [Heterostelium album PN500]EFA79489.1 hypothetical protein PPL_07540 [Heterostelium album PN500]|eukprot:XP_020431610.1 hypothetical protein PPL_07540 [Heterostelium album PN500]